jgi:hypothetical protein
MADEKKEPWLNYLALTTVILAVCATLSTFKGGGFSTRSVLSQTQASDQWAYYQAKSIKGYLYELRKDEIETELRVNADKWPAGTSAIYRDLATSYAGEIARYDAEKTAIQKEARSLEARRDDAQRHARIFGTAVIFLQIAILLSSISALLKRRDIWALGGLIGAVGLVYFVIGLFPAAV